ncbi:hypothetical protein [Candidatus Methylocalor cossyra]
MGLTIVFDVWRGQSVGSFYPRLHGGAALLGSALVIGAALQGDTRLYVNIALAVVIIVLGVVMGVTAEKGKQVPKPIIFTHVSLAIICYLILAFFAFNPRATLPIAV